MEKGEGSGLGITHGVDGRPLKRKGDDLGEDGTEKKTKRQFKVPESADKIYDLSNRKFSEQSRNRIKWALKMFNEWHNNRMSEVHVEGQRRRSDLQFSDYSQQDLCYTLYRFITEVRKMDKSEFPPNSVQEIIIMIQMFLNERGVYWKLLDGENFHQLRNTVDNVMKDRHAKGLGVKKSSQVISLANEAKLFESRALGEENPIQLLRTVIYMLGLHLALRGDLEHMRLRRPGFGCQITTELDDKSGKEILVYREDPLQKTNQGGLIGKCQNKVVKVFPSANRSRCPVKLFGKYIGLLPNSKSCGKLYLHPRAKPTPSVWYCDAPFGKNKIYSNVKDVCKLAGIEGKFTNHSLRATCASRMFSCQIPEQVIKEITGHKSECVRVYKRTNTEMLKTASVSICGENDVKKQENIANTELGQEIRKSAGVSEKVKSVDEGCEVCNSKALTVAQMIKNVVKSRMEMRKKKFSRVVSKLAKKVIKLRKKKIGRKQKESGSNREKIVIDLNVNVKYNK